MEILNFPAGMHVREAAKMLLAAAPASGMFNEIEMKADPEDSADDIVAEFTRQCEERSARYRTSPEGMAAAERTKGRIEAAQAIHDEHITALGSLAFDDADAVLDWLCAIQDATDTSGVKVDKNAILLAFADNGYRPNVNCGEAFDGEDRDNFHRWIVGQALDTLSNVAIHPMIHSFADQWREKFKAAL